MNTDGEQSPREAPLNLRGLLGEILDAGGVPEALSNGIAELLVNADLGDVAARHKLDLGEENGRSRAAGIVDSFYQKAADLVREAQAPERAVDRDHLVGALGALAKVNAIEGAVSFKNEEQARGFAEDMKAQFGDGVLRDMAAGRTEALARDVPDAATRAAIAEAIVSAAKEHPSLGLGASGIEAAERRFEAEAIRRDAEPGRQRVRAHSRDWDL